MSVRKSSYRSLASLERDLSRCRACAEEGFPLHSLSVRAPLASPPQKAYLFGQAPGPVEGVERLPWRGSAGQKLRGWLGLDEKRFYAQFYCASVTRCDPGRRTTGSGDRVPSARERELCGFWHDQEAVLLRPQLYVTVGALSLERLLGLKSGTQYIGRSLDLGGAAVIPLPHPSGVNRWPQVPANKPKLDRALALIRHELSRIYPE